MEAVLFLGLAALVGLLLVVVACVRWSAVIAAPDEWLLLVRDGKLVRAGIGITAWRRPGDMSARFTSTVQRVTFSATAQSREQVPLTVEGFALWSVSPEGDEPFRCFRSLGLANLVKPPVGLKSRQHLLTGPQYKAFQGLLAAEAQQLASTLPFERLLADRPALSEDLSRRVDALAKSLGFRFEKVEVQQVRPADATLGAALSAPREQSVHDEAAKVRAESAERAKRMSVESTARLASEEERLAQERRMAAENGARLLADERRHREEADFAAKLDRIRREAEAERDAALLRGEAEEKKSGPVRAAELQKLATEKVAGAFAALPLKEARWVSVGDSSPVTSLAAMIAQVREAFDAKAQ